MAGFVPPKVAPFIDTFVAPAPSAYGAQAAAGYGAPYGAPAVVDKSVSFEVRSSAKSNAPTTSHVAKALAADEDFTIASAMLASTPLGAHVETVAQKSGAILYVPTNEAFKKLGPSALKELKASAQKQKDLMGQHIHPLEDGLEHMSSAAYGQARAKGTLVDGAILGTHPAIDNDHVGIVAKHHPQTGDQLASAKILGITTYQLPGNVEFQVAKVDRVIQNNAGSVYEEAAAQAQAQAQTQTAAPFAMAQAQGRSYYGQQQPSSYYGQPGYGGY